MSGIRRSRFLLIYWLHSMFVPSFRVELKTPVDLSLRLSITMALADFCVFSIACYSIVVSISALDCVAH